MSFVMLLCSFPSLHAQFTNTYYDEDNYIFYYENGSSGSPGKAQDAYVINSYGEVLQKWTGGDIISPEGAPGYLLENGLLLRGVEGVVNSGEVFQVGAYGILQMVDKDDNVVWEYHGYSTVNDPPNGIRPYCLHHDVEPLPNGNILASVHVVYTEDDAEAELGFTRTGQGKLTLEEIWEIQPDLVNGGGEIVWKWRYEDHLVQDANPGLPNFGDVSNPGLFDINCVRSKSTNARQNGNHFNMNGISYNPYRKQILFSSMKSNEVYIIDHNLTTEEAATSAGDFKWRWGNPLNYNYGGGSPATYSSWVWTKGQHDPRWIVDGNGNPTGSITIHNNHSVTNPKPDGGMFEAWTECLELEPPYDGSSGYTRVQNEPYGPASPTILAEYNPDLPYFNDGYASGAQKLPNGHIFSGSATKFTLLEHDENGNIVWFFDCRDLTPGGGQMWKSFKYPVNYPGFIALGITDNSSPIVDVDLPAGISLYGYTGQNPIDTKEAFQTLIDNSQLALVRWVNPATGGIKELYHTTFPISGWVNEIGDLTLGQGYVVKTTASCTLSISGNKSTTNVTHNLPAGYSIIGFNKEAPVDAQVAFQELISAGKLELVRSIEPSNGTIRELYYTTFPSAGWVNEIGNLVEGQGYIIKLNAPHTGFVLP